MNRSIVLAGVITLATFVVCYAGIRKELNLAKETPTPPVKLAASRHPT